MCLQTNIVCFIRIHTYPRMYVKLIIGSVYVRGVEGTKILRIKVKIF